MKNKICLKLFILMLFIAFISSPAQAVYKKKVLIKQFQNPPKWDKPYSPGSIISKLLNQELMQKKGIHLISISKNFRKPMNNAKPPSDINYVEPSIFDSGRSNYPEIKLIQDTGSEMIKSPKKIIPSMTPIEDDPLWPKNLGQKVHKPTFIEIRGKVIKFLPANRMGGSNASMQSKTKENAEVEVYVELVQHSTGRILHEQNFKTISHLGTQPFSMKKLNFTDMDRSDGLSSMNSALNLLKSEVGMFISKKIDSLPLEGEIISNKRKEIPRENGKKNLVDEEILINIGLLNGVRMGDLFQVHAVGLGLGDPYTANDLGDVYVKIGIIQILEVWEGTAKAMSLAGNNFETGFLVRSMNIKKEEEENVPWWDFNGIR
jgi:hypothetical protein